MQDALILQKPAAEARRLVLLFHGVGATPEGLQPLGAAIARQLPDAWIVSVRSPERSDLGSGWQWFSVRGIDEASRPARVDKAMPLFLETVRRWQRETGVDAEATTLIGFSQGAIMALESTQQSEAVAGRVIAIAGRFAQPPRKAPSQTVLNLMHGEQDPIMPSQLSVDAVARLKALGGSATLDLFPQLAHGIDGRVVEAVVGRVQGHTI